MHFKHDIILRNYIYQSIYSCMNNILDKEPVIRASKALSNFDSALEIQVLDKTARTAIDAANSLNCEVGAIVKSLVFKTNETFLMCLVAGDKKCSLNKVKKIIRNKNLQMANAEEVKIKTGYTIGGVSPIGLIEKMDILIDKSLDRYKNIYAAAGHPNCIFKINFLDLKKITNGKLRKLQNETT